MTSEEQAVEAKLTELEIPYERHDHEPIMTVAEGQKIAEKLGSHCMKNLFLCAKKKTYYLLLLPAEKSFSSKELARQLQCGHLSFGSPKKMAELLKTYPGAVTALGLMFDVRTEVKVLVDKDLTEFDFVDCHPCSNAASLKIAMKDLLEKWLPATGHGDFTTVSI